MRARRDRTGDRSSRFGRGLLLAIGIPLVAACGSSSDGGVTPLEDADAIELDADAAESAPDVGTPDDGTIDAVDAIDDLGVDAAADATDATDETDATDAPGETLDDAVTDTSASADSTADDVGADAACPASCDDGIACTTDACDPITHACTHVPNDAVCDDHLACTGVETCDPASGAAGTGCKAGAPPSCDDGVACTQDFCAVATDACQHVPDDVACDDGLFCDGAEACDPVNGAPGTGCRAGVPPNCDDGVACTSDACSESASACQHLPVDAACDDGVFCDGAEVCDARLGCSAGTPPSCDDARSCTIDACSEAMKQCVHTPSNAACDDGVFCNGVETCSASGPTPTGCVAGTPIACAPDSVACTVDACDEANKSCVHAPSNALCPSGQFCVPAQGGCATGTPCTNAAQCQDGDACNGVEACVSGVCRPGVPVSCDDGIACTVDACNPSTGACAHAPNDAMCDDGLACNGVERCDASVGCALGTPVNCDDGVACTIDRCNEPTGTCAHAASNALCSDGQLCNGVEICDATLGCLPGVPFTCPSDGAACDTVVCDPTLNACKATPHDDLCPCGQTCRPGVGCGVTCTVRTCGARVHAGGDCIDNDGDCRIDSSDTMILGACDDSEDSFQVSAARSTSACTQDCYFDGDVSATNDDCHWSHTCDPLETSPSWTPEGSQCAYDPSTRLAGTTLTCSQASIAQSAQCSGFCGPLTPNGCDGFGCCAIPGAPTPVWLGSTDASGNPTCTEGALADPTRCHPCTQVAATLNPCDHCELCVGKATLPADCVVQTCAGGSAACGLPGQPACPAGQACVTGCCRATP